MTANETFTDLLFFYGTLRLEAVQVATFGRRMDGVVDVLCGYELLSLQIEDQKIVEISGKAQHTMAHFTGRASDRVTGSLFSVTASEIQNSDAYEVTAVKRVAVVLESGKRAWAYVDVRDAPCDSW